MPTDVDPWVCFLDGVVLVFGMSTLPVPTQQSQGVNSFEIAFRVAKL